MNLALACRRCNLRRYNFTQGIDPITQTNEPLFNPRIDRWIDHFQWLNTGLRLQGVTAKGRATCKRLDINDDEHDEGAIINARRYWVQGGWHPPSQDIK